MLYTEGGVGSTRWQFTPFTIIPYWNTRDPKGAQVDFEAIYVAGGLNLYGYAEGDAVNFGDPFGTCPSRMAANTICLAFFIEGESALFLEGDGRGFQVRSDKGQSRAYIVIDVDARRVIDKGFAVSCTTWGPCRNPSGLSQIDAVFGPSGYTDVGVGGHNSITFVPGFSGYFRFTPDGENGFRAQGYATTFPSIEAYYFGADGSATTLIQQRGSSAWCLAFCGVMPLRGDR
jgi:hypothetical protein